METLFTVTYATATGIGSQRKTYARHQCESWARSLQSNLTRQGYHDVRLHAESDDDLTPQLSGLEGSRVEVVTTYGETRRFWVGKSTGWRPCHIEVHNKRSMGGPAAEKQYASVRVVRNA